ncbi:MAG: restriction endonuclease subunit S [Prevotella sp.]|nr:restriction endonuclease subunit S [Prevotella sp.]
MSEWREYRLGDIADIKGGKRLPKGVNLVTTPNNHPYIRIRDFDSNKVLELNNNFEYVDNETQKLISRYIANTDDILLSIVGTIGLVAKVGSSLNNANLTENCVKIKNLHVIDSDFLYYYLVSSEGQNKIKLGTVGAVQPKLPIKNISDITIPVPSIETQRSIASILSSLDDKIAVNRRICENLEAQAQALFKHWFIDFAPFKNGQFVESELGMIPEGWRVGTYSDIIQETISGDWGKEKAEGNYTHKVACIRGCDFQDVKMGLRGKTPERFILEKNYQSKHFEDKDVLVEISGGTATVSTGRICPVSQLLIDKYEGDIVCTNFCRLVRPIKGYSSYLYYSWKYKYDHKVMFGYENGTSGIKNFSIKDFSSREPLILPELSALNEFENIIDHIHTQIQNCGSESAKLTTLRDTLLPKLMSGQIKVNEMEKSL